MLCKQEASPKKSRPFLFLLKNNLGYTYRGKLPIIAIIGSLGFFRAVLLPLLFFSKGAFYGGMVAFSSVDEPTRVDFGK